MKTWYQTWFGLLALGLAGAGGARADGTAGVISTGTTGSGTNTIVTTYDNRLGVTINSNTNNVRNSGSHFIYSIGSRYTGSGTSGTADRTVTGTVTIGSSGTLTVQELRVGDTGTGLLTVSGGVEGRGGIQISNFKLQASSIFQTPNVLNFKRTLNYPVGSRRHPFTEGEYSSGKYTPLLLSFREEGELARAGGVSDEVGFGGSDSPSVKGWTRSGRGSSALTGDQRETSNFKLQVNPKSQNRNFKVTLNYPVATRHPFTEGEFARAGGTVSGGDFRGSVNNSPLVEGWTRSGRGVSAFGWDFGFGDWDLLDVWNLKFGISPRGGGNLLEAWQLKFGSSPLGGWRVWV